MRILFRILFFVFIVSPRTLSQSQFTQNPRYQPWFRPLTVKEIDNLRQVLSNARDTSGIKCLVELSVAYDWFNVDSAFMLAKQAYSEALKYNYVRGMAESVLNIATLQTDTGNYAEAEKYFRQAIPLLEKINDSFLLGAYFLWFGKNRDRQGYFNEAIECYDKVFSLCRNKGDSIFVSPSIFWYKGESYEVNGEYEKSFEYYKKSFDLGSSLNYGLTISNAGYKMGNLYRDIGDYETAMEYYREAENHALSNHLEFFAEAEINKAIGILYSLRGQYDSSLYYLQRAKGLYGRRNRDIQIAIGETYLLQKRYREALALFLPLLKNFRTANDVPLLMKTLHDLGKVYGALQQNGAALNYGKELLIIAQQKNTKQYIRDAAQLLSTIYAVKKQFDSAYKYHQLYAALKDSIETKQYLFRLARNKDEAESLKMNAEIKLLNKDKQIQQQQLDKESFARKILIGSILGLLLLSIIIVRVIMLKRKNEAHRRELAENELEIEKLENEKTKAELKQQATELEMQALRAQMNPHFIFNSLNSIDLFILQNDKAQASKYLTKFSRLIRIILTSSANASVSLAEDIEALQLYLELERVRCDKKFSFEIKYDPVIDTDFIQVPPMLLQPFAENAIWHGLMNKEGEGHLCININQEESTVICTIIDDGIGRKKAAELANKSGKHKSMGMKITESRISMMQKMNDGRSIVIRDLVDADGNAAGTEVVLKIPVAQI